MGSLDDGIEIEVAGGLHLVDSILWLDAPRRVDLCFLSHAHVAAPLRHGKILTTALTSVLAGQKIEDGQRLLSPYYRRFALGGLDLELHPAGHIPGSAQLLVTVAGRRLVYTGQFRLEGGAEPGRILECEVLVLDATHAAPHMRLPPRAEVEEELVAWVRGVLSDGGRPALVCQSLGSGQELGALLGAHGLEARMHPALYRFAKLLGLTWARRMQSRPGPAEVLLLPAGRAVGAGLRAAVVSGRVAWETIPGFERGFALSSVADFEAAVRYARESGARRIYTAGEQAEPLAAHLRSLGLRAWSLKPPEQLDLFARTG